MKGLGDISQHRCLKHLESKRCMGEPSRHTIGNDQNEGQKSEQGCSKSAQIYKDIKKVIEVWVSQVGMMGDVG